MNVKLPDGTIVTDIPEGTSQLDLIAKLERNGYDVSAMKQERHDAAVKADQQASRERFTEEEKSRPLGERILTNIGAGFHKLGQAVTFADKADVEEHNKYRAGAAETMPGGQYVQMAAEALPTMLVPAGAGGTLAARMLPKAAAKLGGLIGPRAASVLNVAGTQGALGALTTAGDAGDRAIGAGLGAGAGAALPAAVAAVQSARRVITQPGARLAAGERFLQELEQETPGRATDLVESLRDPVARARQQLGGVERPTAAQLTGDPVLRELEVGARTRQGASFGPGDEAAAQGRANVLRDIAQGPQELAAAEAARRTATAPLRDTALQAAGQVQGFERPVMQTALQIASGESRSNPAVQTMVNYVTRELEQGVTPGQLYTIRKTLTTGVPTGTELGSAITQSRAERMKLVEAIDQALNSATGGQWSTYMQRYQQMSPAVTSMRTGQAIARDFAGGANTTQLGDPILTASKLRQAILRRGEKQFGGTTQQRLTPEARSSLEAVADTLESETRARMSQGLTGSRTAGNIAAGENVGALAGGVGTLVGGIPGAVIGNVLPRWHGARAERILADLLRDPEMLARMIERAQGARRTTQSVAELGRIGQLGGEVLE